MKLDFLNVKETEEAKEFKSDILDMEEANKVYGEKFSNVKEVKTLNIENGYYITKQNLLNASKENYDVIKADHFMIDIKSAEYLFVNDEYPEALENIICKQQGNGWLFLDDVSDKLKGINQIPVKGMLNKIETKEKEEIEKQAAIELQKQRDKENGIESLPDDVLK